jgi:hypothetical protein
MNMMMMMMMMTCNTFAFQDINIIYVSLDKPIKSFPIVEHWCKIPSHLLHRQDTPYTQREESAFQTARMMQIVVWLNWRQISFMHTYQDESGMLGIMSE